MRRKIVLMVYNHIDLNSLAKTAKAFNELVEEFKVEGREIEYEEKDFIKYKDGSTIQLINLTTKYATKGRRITHLYVDSNVFSFKYGRRFVHERLYPCLVTSDDFNAKERVSIF